MDPREQLPEQDERAWQDDLLNEAQQAEQEPPQSETDMNRNLT